MSTKIIHAILVRACKVAKGFAAGTLRHPKPRTSYTLQLTDLSPRWIADVDAWATMRGKSRRAAATELVRIGLDATSVRAEKQTGAKLRGTRKSRASKK